MPPKDLPTHTHTHSLGERINNGSHGPNIIRSPSILRSSIAIAGRYDERKRETWTYWIVEWKSGNWGTYDDHSDMCPCMFTRDYMSVGPDSRRSQPGWGWVITSRTAADLGSDCIYAQLGTNDVRPTLPL